MLNDIVSITKKHEDAALTIYDRIITDRSNKYIVTISGEVASGKCEISIALARLFKKEGVKCKILHMDDYYKVPPEDRTHWRQKHGIESIGYNEYDWNRVRQNIIDFKNGKKASVPSVDLITLQVDEIITDFAGIDMLIINGLYSVMIKEANLRVFVELTYKETLEQQIAEKKEELDEFRMKVLEREHEVVQSLKPEADFYIDFDNSLEAFHL
jgi:uridine kinase